MGSSLSRNTGEVAYHRCSENDDLNDRDDEALSCCDGKGNKGDLSRRHGAARKEDTKKESDAKHQVHHLRGSTSNTRIMNILVVVFISLGIFITFLSPDSLSKVKGWWQWLNLVRFSSPHPHNVIVVEKFKLVFFLINKNGSTSWLILLRKMMGIDIGLEKTGYLHSKHFSGLKYISDYSKEERAHFLTSPEWTRAVFLRDPITRWLSSYLDKEFEQPGTMANKVCPRQIRKKRFNSFEQCRQYIEEEPANGFEIMKDSQDLTIAIHWLPQSTWIGTRIEPLINFKGRMENLEADSEALLRRIGAWEEFGATGYGPDGTDRVFKKRESPNRFQADGSVSGQNHATQANEHLKQYIDANLKAKLLEYYKVDYDNSFFNFTVPSF